MENCGWFIGAHSRVSGAVKLRGLRDWSICAESCAAKNACLSIASSPLHPHAVEGPRGPLWHEQARKACEGLYRGSGTMRYDFGCFCLMRRVWGFRWGGSRPTRPRSPPEHQTAAALHAATRYKECLHTYIHTCVHTYIYIYICIHIYSLDRPIER